MFQTQLAQPQQQATTQLPLQQHDEKIQKAYAQTLGMSQFSQKTLDACIQKYPQIIQLEAHVTHCISEINQLMSQAQIGSASNDVKIAQLQAPNSPIQAIQQRAQEIQDAVTPDRAADVLKACWNTLQRLQ
eukprot:EST42468.1 Hypothetical protein SS50377_17774 [Spironucleus salmonicida]